jgi:hypothetical protein
LNVTRHLTQKRPCNLLASDLFVAVELQTEVLLQSGEESNHQQGCQANGDH